MTPAKRLLLASRSPRRLSLLRQIGLSPEILPCDVPEDFDSSLSAAENARVLAVRKAEAAAAVSGDAIVLGADTIVVIDGQLLAKPLDKEDAVRMLKLLSGHTHTVYTGFALVDAVSGRTVDGVEATQVTFRPMTDEEIRGYVDGGSPMDKAGAYGIQDDYGAVFVSRIEGCFYNVVGLPLSRVYMALRELESQLNIS